jgi:hypothetical protein
LTKKSKKKNKEFIYLRKNKKKSQDSERFIDSRPFARSSSLSFVTCPLLPLALPFHTTSFLMSVCKLYVTTLVSSRFMVNSFFGHFIKTNQADMLPQLTSLSPFFSFG